MLWSKRESLLALRMPGLDRQVRIVGRLPRPPRGKTNVLWLLCNNSPIGSIVNRSEGELSFDRIFPLHGSEPTLNFRFLTDYTFRPALWGVNTDQRDLGFALERIEVRH